MFVRRCGHPRLRLRRRYHRANMITGQCFDWRDEMANARKTPVDLQQDRDLVVDRWLRDEVARTYDEVIACPDRVVPAETVRERLQLRNLERRAGHDH